MPNFSFGLEKAVEENLTLFGAGYEARASLGLEKIWRKCEDYYRSNQNTPKTDDDVGSVTNMIFPTIISQVSDLVDDPMEISIVGEEPSDDVFSKDLGYVMDWIFWRNKMFQKIEKSETRRLKFGTTVWKCYYDPVLDMIVYEPISPVNFIPDPKIKEPWLLHQADFCCHASWLPMNYVKRMFPEEGRKLKSTSSKHTSRYDLNIFDHEDNEQIKAITNNKCLFIERWGIEGNRLVKVSTADEYVMYDSRKDNRIQNKPSKSFYNKAQYPFTIIPCYPVEGRVWGMGDAEYLIPTQDLINDLDDQIRANARLMGNLQIVVGLASGINIKKWTNKAGLKIPARDPNAWSAVQPPTMPAYITNRRDRAFSEGEMISGRPDVSEGRQEGSVRAASAILAMQEAGNRRARHKKVQLETGMTQMVDTSIDYLKEFFPVQKAYRILGRDPGYIWFRGSDLKQVPRLQPDPNGVPDEATGKVPLVPLTDKDGQQMVKDAKFDVRVSLGAGLPHNKAFLYQSTIELANSQIITREEAREFVKDCLDWPIADPYTPQGTFAGVGASYSQGGGGNPLDTQSIPPELMNQIVAALGSQGGLR